MNIMDKEQISVIPHELLLKLCIGMRHVSCTSMHWLYAKKLLTLLTVQGIKVFTVFDDGKFLTLQNEYTTDQFYNVMNTLKLTIFSHLSFNPLKLELTILHGWDTFDIHCSRGKTHLPLFLAQQKTAK